MEKEKTREVKINGVPEYVTDEQIYAHVDQLIKRQSMDVAQLIKKYKIEKLQPSS